jgi:hypothetical protein
MKYTILVVFFILSCILTISLGYCIVQAITDNIYWLLTLIGILPTTVVSVLITAAAFSARKDF